MVLLMLSCPQLLEGFRLDKYCRVTALLVVLNLKVMFLLSNVIECKTLRSIYSKSLVFHNSCFE